jgi:hypothetical protein
VTGNEQKMFYIRGVVRKTGLKESIAVIARNVNEAILQASTFADQVEFERELKLGKDWQ